VDRGNWLDQPLSCPPGHDLERLTKLWKMSKADDRAGERVLRIKEPLSIESCPTIQLGDRVGLATASGPVARPSHQTVAGISPGVGPRIEFLGYCANVVACSEQVESETPCLRFHCHVGTVSPRGLYETVSGLPSRCNCRVSTPSCSPPATDPGPPGG
jgi:hypothetical protein